MSHGFEAPPGGNDWGAFSSAQPGSIPTTDELSNEALIRSTADVALSARIDIVSTLGGGGGSIVSAEVASLVQIASLAATSADGHANTVSSRLVSVSSELASLIQIASSVATGADTHANTASTAATSVDAHANVISARVVSVSAELVSLVQIASTAATSADGHANTVSARLVSVSSELGSLIQIASVAATSADSHANTVSARAVSISNELGSLLASASAALESHINAVSAAGGGGAGSMTSNEISALVQTASVAATSADAHANTVSVRAVSISAELVSLIQIASAAATSADSHANTVSARAVSISNELGSLVQIASLAATSANNHANTVSQRAVSISNELGSLLASTSAALETHINAVSAAIEAFEIKDPVVAATTSALPFTPSYNNGVGNDGIGATLSGSVGILAFDGYTPVLGDRLLIKNEAGTLTNGIYTVTTVGTVLIGYVLTRAVDFNQTANVLYGDTVGVLQGTVNANQQFTMNNQTTITLGTTAITFAQTSGGSQLSAGTGISITGNVIAVVASVAGADAHADTVSSRVVSISTELASLIQIASAAATSADSHANTVSVRAVSISNELGSLIQIASLAATSADTHANTASSAATSADNHANTVSARAVSISNELGSLLASASAALEIHINAVSAAGGGSSVTSNEVSVLVQVASAAATSADGHANAVSARVVSVSAELVSLLASAVNTASAQAASANNVISARVVSISNELGSLLASTSAALAIPSVGIVQPYIFDTDTTDSDPGSGKLRFNNSSPTSATLIYADNNNSLATDVSTWLDSWASGSSSYRPVITITKKGDPNTFVQFQCTTAAIIDGTGYRKIGVTHLLHLGTISNTDNINVDIEIQYIYDSLIQTASAAATSVNTRLNAVSAVSGAGFAIGLQTVVNNLSSRAETISARAVSISNELGSLLASANTARTNAEASIRAEFASVDTSIRAEFASVAASIRAEFASVDVSIRAEAISLIASQTARRAVNTAAQASITVSGGSTVSGVSIALTAGQAYSFEFLIPITALSPAGLVVQVLAPSVTNYSVMYMVPTSNTPTGVLPAAVNYATWSAANPATKYSVGSITLTGVTILVRAWGTINPSGSGSIKFLIGPNTTNVANSGVVVQAGANVKVWRHL